MSNLAPEYTPVFIQGIMARSGTNFLYDLLCLHPDCCSPRLYENYLLTHAEWLERYVREVTEHWDPNWGQTAATAFAALGKGLLTLLEPATPRPRLITKTPSVHNLPLLSRLWPQAYLLILVRDGRAVVESGVRSFSNWTYESGIQRWAAAAKSILEFDTARQGIGQPHRIVRYEDLFGQPEEELPRVLAFLGLDPTRYDLERARNLPVRGSSTDRGQSSQLHWGRVEKSTSFAPLDRWQAWPPARHARFNWVAGGYMRQLGYTLVEPSGSPHFWNEWNRWQDRRRRWQSRLKGARRNG